MLNCRYFCVNFQDDIHPLAHHKNTTQNETNAKSQKLCLKNASIMAVEPRKVSSPMVYIP